MITDKEIEEAATKSTSKKMKDLFWGLGGGAKITTSTCELWARRDFIDGATWAIAEIQKRSMVGFEEHIASLDSWEIPISAEQAWQAAKLSSAAETAKKDERIAELELALKGNSGCCILCEEQSRKITALESRLKDAEEGLRFYANWMNTSDGKIQSNDTEIMHVRQPLAKDKHGVIIGGKRAREYFTKYPKE